MVRSERLEAYRTLVDGAVLDEIYLLAELLRGRVVVHFNTTAEGGGVAGMLQMLMPVLNDLGIQHIWEVLQLDAETCRFMARLSDMLQGGDPGEVTDSEHSAFLESIERAASAMSSVQADVYYVHDIQLAPLAQVLPHLRPACWFCHLDTARPNPNAEQYLRQFLGVYEECTFNTPYSVFAGMRPEHTSVMTLGIDPFITKHAPLSRPEGLERLARCGIDLQRPLITQVSRFGRWKNPWQAIDAYRLVKQEIPEVQLALVGALQAIDDIKALEVLESLRGYAEHDRDIHLLSDPALIGDNEVNAFQRFSTVVLQRSSREGFGFTVTEAMWKEQPVVGTSATGLRYQIRHGENGFIADQTEACAAYTAQLIRNPALRRELGTQAYETVRQRFLLPMTILDYFRVLTRVLE